MHRCDDCFSKGVQAAWDAVNAQHLRTDDGHILRQGWSWENALDRAIAAIDALREEN